MYVVPESVVCIATGYGLDGPGILHKRCDPETEFFTTCSFVEL
jgi:hypothetical protein